MFMLRLLKVAVANAVKPMQKICEKYRKQPYKLKTNIDWMGKRW